MQKIILLGIILISGCQDISFANTISDKKAVMAILGEAENQSLVGMIAVGEVIRTRGSLRGVYGYLNVKKRYANIPLRLKKEALYAWHKSAHTQFSHGATNWENVSRFGWPYWAKNMTVVAQIGDHVFLK